ncbi:hypothetical protein KIN34_14520 [Cellulomonas sp. DKR-3]|uniref:DUF4244 domain-containing protein n=1 Tax=Cellulomonas fulva TaxID=2835530 RepID=A0ABS5U2A4_9CELL|nr:hypothetical protein [Cellulomonas fulva]MBT0995497.1 hypothetical protein [Cellulomonas fulva]
MGRTTTRLRHEPVRAVARVHAWMVRRVDGAQDRGDVPGWVMVTLMTAGIVTILWALAQPLLSDLFDQAVRDVKAPKG